MQPNAHPRRGVPETNISPRPRSDFSKPPARTVQSLAGKAIVPGGTAQRRAVGIDLGTTYSAVACVDGYGKPQIIPNSQNERITPSVILFEQDNASVGATAKQMALAAPEQIVDFVKREMGKSSAQFVREFYGRSYLAEELSALILKKLKQDAEKYLGEEVTDAVITVPAYFNDAERTATLRAGQLAGLNILQIINEPTASALAYGVDQLEQDQTVFVFDLGGGTFDVAIMRIEKGQIRMLASNGDHRLGGKDWDDIICHWAADEFEKVHGENPLLDMQSYQELYTRAVTAKLQLSSRASTTLVHSYNGKSVRVELSRRDFEDRARPLIEKCKAICEIVLEEAQLDWPAIDRILLTGGMTRLPAVRELIAELAPGVPLVQNVNPDETIALGAAIQATLALMHAEDAGDVPTTTLMVRGKLSGRNGRPITVTDITTHVLGVVLWDEDAKEEYVFPMIPKMTPLPAEAKQSFGTSKPNMKNVSVRIVEGDSTRPGECSPLGTCDISLPAVLPKGSMVEVTYAYNANQVLEVRVATYGRRSEVSIARNAGLVGKDLASAETSLSEIRVS
jgi:molecular chaperone DnaK